MPVKVALGFEHVKTADVGVTETVGKTLLSVITALVVAVQPFDPMAVTIYVPPAAIVADANVEVNPPGPVHE
jgi:hypothetical protein